MPETQEQHSLPGILAEIVRTKRTEVDELKGRARELERGLLYTEPPRGFRRALALSSAVGVIAECKRRSPGAGLIRPGLDPAELTSGYEAAGATALSVLTDPTYFGGSLGDLKAVRRATACPILRKDFTLDPIQLIEARAAGADAVLLIARILDDPTLDHLLREAVQLGLDVLVEVHDPTELARAVTAGADLIGINNRDLATFTTDLETTLRLLEGVPAEALVVSESGIRTRADVVRLGMAGVDAILVGESLLAAADPVRATRDLVGVPRDERARA